MAGEPQELEAQLVPVADLQPYGRNPRIGDVGAISVSLERNGQYRPIVVNRRDMTILAGNHTWKAAKALGWDKVAVTYVDVSDEQARRIVLVDNRSNDVASYDEYALAELLEAVVADDGVEGLLGTGFDGDDMDNLLTDLAERDVDPAIKAEIEAGKAAAPKQRTQGLDLIFSNMYGALNPESYVGFRLGWLAGIISTSAASARKFYEVYPRAPRLGFMDNAYHDYDHAVHAAAIAEFKPKYATTRDIFTKQQAEEAGVTWQSVEQTLEQAAELAEHAENVILIPKYDCLDKLPEQYVLGYSVQTSYGGTALPAEAFRGRRVHLLGGSWTKQRAYLNVLGDDVVSLDNNHLLLVAQYGQVCMPDGTTKGIDELLGVHVSRQFFPAMALSMANIATAIKDDFGVDLAQLSNNDPDLVPLDEMDHTNAGER